MSRLTGRVAVATGGSRGAHFRVDVDLQSFFLAPTVAGSRMSDEVVEVLLADPMLEGLVPEGACDVRR
jgi:hypothetical protein